MRDQPAALGYLRSDVSGPSQPWDEANLRSIATRFGYELLKTVRFDSHTDRPVHRLRILVARLDIDAVITPSIEHFDRNQVPAELVAVADVITVSPENTYARDLHPWDPLESAVESAE